MNWRASMVVGAIALATAGAAAQSAGNSAEGHRLAGKICDACHVAAPDQPFKPLLDHPAPSFRSIANKPDATAQSLFTFVMTTHRTTPNPRQMPNPMLNEDQATSIVAYILSLRGARL